MNALLMNAQTKPMCLRHDGAKRKLCSIDECTNEVIEGGVCIRYGAKRNYAALMDAQTHSSKEECASDMGQRSNDVALMDILIKRNEEECVEVSATQSIMLLHHELTSSPVFLFM